MDVPKLIVLVQNYPELFDMRHPEYFNNVRRDNCWEEIGAIMNEEGSVCKDRWTKVRDNHRKALQRRKTKSGQAASNKKPPKYEKGLQFLIPYITDEDNRQSNFTQPESPAVTLDNDDEDELLDTDDPLSPETSQVASQRPSLLNRPHSSSSAGSTSTTSGKRNSPYGYRKRSRPGVSTEKTAATVLDEYLGSKRGPAQTEPEDSLTSFFFGNVETVKGFPIKDQIQVKQAIFHIVTKKEIDIASREYSSVQLDAPLPHSPDAYYAPLPTEKVPQVTKSTSLPGHSPGAYHAPLPTEKVPQVTKSTSLPGHSPGAYYAPLPTEKVPQVTKSTSLPGHSPGAYYAPLPTEKVPQVTKSTSLPGHSPGAYYAPLPTEKVPQVTKSTSLPGHSPGAYYAHLPFDIPDYTDLP